jgi:hypothetical protein
MMTNMAARAMHPSPMITSHQKGEMEYDLPTGWVVGQTVTLGVLHGRMIA